MAAIHIESSSESSGRVRGGSARDDGEHSASPSSVSSSFMEETVGSSGPEPASPDAAGSRIIHDIPIFLLRGGIRIDGSPYEPNSDGTVLNLAEPVGQLLIHPTTPTIPVFFHYFEVRPPTQGGWVSLTSVRDMTLFRPFSDSFKNFKHHYFKVIIDTAGRHEFHNAEGNPLFPFYWTREPRKIRAFPVRVLGPADLEAVRTINALPRRISARHLVECLCLEDCEQKASHDDSCTPPIQLYGLQEARWGQFVIGLDEGCAERSSSSPREAVLLIRLSAPGTLGTAATIPCRSGQGFYSREPGPDPPSSLAPIFVDLSSEAATVSVAPSVRKRKDPTGEGRKDKEASSSRSASKKARKGKESSSQRALIEPLSEGELTNAMLEMSTRAASLAWYLKEFADRRGADDVRAELLAEQKNSTSLQSAMVQLILNQDDYDKRIEQLEADLEKAKRESTDAKDRLAVARGDHERLLEECSQLKTKVSHQRSFEVGLLKTNQALTDDLAKARERISELEAGIIFEHEEEPSVRRPSSSAYRSRPSGAVGADEAVEVEEEGDGGDD
ncbi:hypothetical protein LR48_Vigan01g185700 [Vigna angularis]|uniref:Uncharacterized protein n=1 Tax=Phaseolus angularis TaxID=3914 RepID=A0A0L9TPA5_PHAAN|nr:hypothetical protein LR48_Vigan01g185700 [Vigna angularis]